MELHNYVVLALGRLKLSFRPCTVDQYGHGPDAIFKVTVDCGHLRPVVTYKGEQFSSIVGVCPEPDDLTPRIASVLAREALEGPCRHIADESVVATCHRLETEIAKLPPPVAAIVMTTVEKWFEQGKAGDFRAEDAARRGYRRACGDKSMPPVATLEERELNRQRSLIRQAEIARLADQLEAKHGYQRRELTEAMASMILGGNKAVRKLKNKIGWARKSLFNARPYLTGNKQDPSPNAIYCRHTASETMCSAKDTHEQLVTDFDVYAASVRKQIEDAEALLAGSVGKPVFPWGPEYR